MSWSHVWCRLLSASLPSAITTCARVDQCSCLWAIINITQYRFYKGIKRLVWQNRSHFITACGKRFVFFQPLFLLLHPEKKSIRIEGRLENDNLRLPFFPCFFFLFFLLCFICPTCHHKKVVTIWVIYQAKMPKSLWFQFLKCQDLLLFSFISM